MQVVDLDDAGRAASARPISSGSIPRGAASRKIRPDSAAARTTAYNMIAATISAAMPSASRKP